MSDKINSLQIRFKDSEHENVRAELLVDNEPIVNSDYVLDLDELEKSIDHHGKFFILTCESNEPSHIEMSKGINIHKDDSDNFHWEITDNSFETSFVFDGESYRKSVLEAAENWKKLVIEKESGTQLSFQDIHSYVKYDEALEDEEEYKN